MAKKDLVVNAAGDDTALPNPRYALPNPPPGGEGTNEKGIDLIPVAYHAGPEEIGYYNKQWQRDVAQPLTREDWAAMQARGDFDEFNFIEEK